jgi:hypothetical protein
MVDWHKDHILKFTGLVVVYVKDVNVFVAADQNSCYIEDWDLRVLNPERNIHYVLFHVGPENL